MRTEQGQRLKNNPDDMQSMAKPLGSVYECFGNCAHIDQPFRPPHGRTSWNGMKADCSSPRDCWQTSGKRLERVAQGDLQSIPPINFQRDLAELKEQTRK